MIRKTRVFLGRWPSFVHVVQQLKTCHLYFFYLFVGPKILLANKNDGLKEFKAWPVNL